MMLQCPLFPENHNAAAMAPADLTVAEWHRARLNWLQQQQHQSHFTATSMALDLHPHTFSILPASTAALRTCSAFVDEVGPVFHEPGNNMPPSLVHYPILGSRSFVTGTEGGDGPVLRTFSCPPVVGDGEAKATPSGATASPFDRHGAQVTAATDCLEVGRKVSSRKRKAPPQASIQEPEDEEEEYGDGCCASALVEPKLEAPPISSTSGATTTANPTGDKEALSETSKEKGCEPPLKSDYIHVRARRGQATDSHSLAERVRREKISKRMKLLQELVPGCNRITGKAGVLDEIINYVQSLQRQVEFLSMKLAVVNPALDSNMDAFFTKEILQMIPHCGGVVPPLMGVRPPELLDASFLTHANTTQTQQAVAAMTAVDCGGLDIAATSSFSDQEAVLLSQAATSAPDGCSVMDSHKVRALATMSPWEAELHGLYSTVHELQQGWGGGAPSSTAPMITNPNPST